MKKFVSRGLTVINLLIVLGIAFYGFHFKNSSFLNQKSSILVEAFQNELLSNYSYSGEKFTNDYVQSLIGDTIKINDLGLKTPKIVLRMSQLNCSDCLEKEIRTIQGLSKNLGIENYVIIFVSYHNLNDLNAFIRVNSITLPVYTVDNNTFKAPDSENRPYYFILDESQKIERLYFPINEEMTKAYFSIYKNRYH